VFSDNWDHCTSHGAMTSSLFHNKLVMKRKTWIFVTHVQSFADQSSANGQKTVLLLVFFFS
jgi:hypothetical protein